MAVILTYNFHQYHEWEITARALKKKGRNFRKSAQLNGQLFIRHNLVETVSVQQLHSTLVTLAWPIVLPWNPARHRWIWWLSPRLKFHAKVCVHGHQGQPFPGAPSLHCESESVGRLGWAGELQGHNNLWLISGQYYEKMCVSKWPEWEIAVLSFVSYYRFWKSFAFSFTAK